MQSALRRMEDKTLNLGFLPVVEAVSCMQVLVSDRAQEKIGNRILFAQHPPTYTLGRGIQLSIREQHHFPEENLDSLSKRLPYEVVEVERGGGITFHDPGQIMGYPIVKLDPTQRFGIREYLRTLETYLRRSLLQVFPDHEFVTSSEATGIWIEGKKVVSIGIAIRRWVSHHGFAVHVNTDLDGFRRIRPCGLAAGQIGNLPLGEWSSQFAREQIMKALENNFSLYF